MQRLNWRLCIGLLFAAGCWAQSASPPAPLTWQAAEEKFRADNPTLLAGSVNIDESKADEITAYLRPNPNLNLTADDLGLFSYSPFQPTANGIFAGSVDYLHEREHKRELRLASAKQGTAIAISTQADLERNLIYNLRDAFVRVLLAKAVQQVGQENKQQYLKEAVEVRDTISFSYQHGAASLLDFLDAQKEYRDVELAYVNLVGSYLSAANQLNLAVGREVIR